MKAKRSTTRQRLLPLLARTVLIGHVIIILGGCGVNSTKPYATITGMVTVNGKPIKEGKVIYYPGTSGGTGGGSAKISDGKYSLNKVPLGSIAFTFSASAETGKTVPGPGGVPEPERVNIIPAKYGSEGITRQITGDGVQDFAIEKEGP
jgi:hypothetical protein